MWDLDYKESWVPRNWCFWTVVLEKALESPLDCKMKLVNPKGNQSWIFIGSTDTEWSSNILATWCEELTHWKRPWCWERLKTGGEGDNKWGDGWMASQTRRTYIWVSFGSWWWTGKAGVLQSTGSQRVGHNWVNELNRNVLHFSKWNKYLKYHLLPQMACYLWSLRGGEIISILF